MNFKIFSLCVILVFTTASCSTTSFPKNGEGFLQKAKDIGRKIATEAGSVAGAVLGAGFCDSLFKNSSLKNELKVGCTLVGAYVGDKISRHLREEDRARQAAATHQAMVSGKSSSWENPETKIKGKARVVSTQTVAKPVKVKVLKGKVKTVPPLDIIGAAYETISTSGTNVRGGPSTDYVVVGKLESATPVNVIGKVKEKEWYLISEDGVGSGFVFASLLKEAPAALVESDPDKVDSSLVEEQQVAEKRICRTIENSIQLADGTVHKETVNACRGPNGWETQAIT